jgi:hypothetical protein
MRAEALALASKADNFTSQLTSQARRALSRDIAQ